MKKLLFTLFLSLMVGTTAYATFPVRRTFLHQQPNGQSLSVHSVGNGRYYVYSTVDGRAILPAADGNFYYARRSATGLVASTTLASDMLPTALQQRLKTASAEEEFLTATEANDLLATLYPPTPVTSLSANMKPQSLASSTPTGLGQYGLSANGVVKSIGSPILPVVMVEFSDVAFCDTITTETKVDRFFNETGYHDENFSCGSVRDYFIAQSDSLFKPTFKVIARVKLDHERAYYGKNNGSVIDAQGTTFVREALEKASAVANFAPFRTPETTNIPIVILMFAGPGEQSSFEDGSEDYLWAKFSQSSFSVNGGTSKVQSYFMGSELMQKYGSSKNDILGRNFESVGLYAHEFTHALGFPDLYNTKGSNKFKTLGYWDLMDYGQYFQNGYCPSPYSAYERAWMGWLPVEELTDEACYAKLIPLDSPHGTKGTRAYVLRNEANPQEYYILENRAPSTWYSALMGRGMLVTHVDYKASIWNANTVNTEQDHQRVQIIPADNVLEGNSRSGDMTWAIFWKGYQSDLYPGLNINNTSLTDMTTPSTSVFTGNGLNKPIYNISLSPEGIISFSYLDPEITGIHEVNTVVDTSSASSTTAVPLYDLNGRRIQIPAAPGVYITKGGKKVIVKK